MNSGKKLTTLGVALVGVGLLLMAPAFACSVKAETWSTPAQAAPGTVVTIKGAYFNGAGAPVDIYWGGATSGVVLGTATLTSQGDFSQSVTIPSNAERNADYLIQSVRRDPNGEAGQSAGYTFHTSPPPAASSQPEPTSANQQPAASNQPQAAPANSPQPAPANSPQPQSDVPASNPGASAPAGGSTPSLTPIAVPVASAVPVRAPAPVAATAAVQEVPVAVEATPSVSAESEAPQITTDVQPLTDRSARLFGSAPAPEVRIPGSRGVSGWLLAPLALIALGLFSFGSAIVAHDARRRQVRADI